MGAFDPEYLKEALGRFADGVVDKAQRNLTSQRRNVSGTLRDSIDYNLKESASGDSFSLDFLMEKYGMFIDEGVSGIKKKYNTPYSYKSKMPPRGVIDKWVVRKRLSGIRDDKGVHISQKLGVPNPKKHIPKRNQT